jgi:hypothetical protein
MTGLLRGVTILNAILFFGASLFHRGIFAGGASTAQQFRKRSSVSSWSQGCSGSSVLHVRSAEPTGASPHSALFTYAIVIAGTLLGLGIVIGAPSMDRWIHVAMITGLGIGLALILWNRTPTKSARRALRPWN